MIAGNPKVYGQLVHLLAPYTRVIAGATAGPDGDADAAATPESALAASVPGAAPEACAEAVAGKAPVRMRKQDRAGGDTGG